MLVLSRRADESIVIQPADGVDATMTLAQFFANGPILITLLGGTGPARQDGHRSSGTARHSPQRRRIADHLSVRIAACAAADLV
jgi:hypothetical protein